MEESGGGREETSIYGKTGKRGARRKFLIGGGRKGEIASEAPCVAAVLPKK